MKPSSSLSTLFVSLFTAASLPATAAAIALDFGGTGQDVQAGYLGVSGTGTGLLPSPIFSVPSAALPGGESMTITSSTSLSFRDRGSYLATSYGPNVDLYEDYLRAGTATAGGEFSTMTIDLGGLLANTNYQLTLRLYDGGISAATAGAYSYTITGTNDSNAANNTYNITFHSNSPGLPPADQAGYTELFRSTGSGTLQITVTQSLGGESSIPMNSFDLVVVPEPISAMLAIPGALVAMARRRRRS